MTASWLMPGCTVVDLSSQAEAPRAAAGIPAASPRVQLSEISADLVDLDAGTAGERGRGRRKVP